MQTTTSAADFDNRLSAVESRLSRLEGIVEQIDKRMASLETRMASLETGQRWIVGIQFTTLIALGTLILVKL
ncbi:MAG: hypothetical protein OXR72_07490 [Gemmatimonadota bacterium]|nr:hypothetical protein [Gemmatimonadota bacterium]